MHLRVQAVLKEFLSRFEGVRRSMYLDNRSLVTTGIGFMLPSLGEAGRLHWRHPAGRAAGPEELAAEWSRVTGRWPPVEGASPLLITPGEVDRVFASQVRARELILKAVFPAWESYPADAQLGMLAHSWLAASRGSIEGWQGGDYVKAVRERRWDDAGGLSLWGAIRDPAQPRQAERRDGMLKMFHNATVVQGAIQRGAGVWMPADTLFYPDDAFAIQGIELVPVMDGPARS
ncbi:MAG: hypothetical protein HY822_23720 [Acidobacteria bacterium]|nr:hypothetical protein [Acidobacteriota bacterium]